MKSSSMRPVTLPDLGFRWRLVSRLRVGAFREADRCRPLPRFVGKLDGHPLDSTFGDRAIRLTALYSTAPLVSVSGSIRTAGQGLVLRHPSLFRGRYALADQTPTVVGQRPHAIAPGHFGNLPAGARLRIIWRIS